MPPNATDGFVAIRTVLFLCAKKLSSEVADAMLEQVFRAVLPLSRCNARSQGELLEDVLRLSGEDRRNSFINSTALFLDDAIARRAHETLYEDALAATAPSVSAVPL